MSEVRSVLPSELVSGVDFRLGQRRVRRIIRLRFLARDIRLETFPIDVAPDREAQTMVKSRRANAIENLPVVTHVLPDEILC